MELPFGLNPYENDRGAWGASLLLNAEVLLACLEAADASSVVEVGAFEGDLTRLLLLWGEPRGTRIVAIDPAPAPQLEQLQKERQDLELIRQTSLRAFEHIQIPDAVILDGDHNYYMVTEELGRIAARAGDQLPLILLHDVCWPLGRRDQYFDPDRIPADHRQPMVPEGGLFPGVEGTWPGAMRYHWPAAREGGPRNGVLTAVEDFLSNQPELQLAVVPTFFGLGVVWHREAPYASTLADVLVPWDRNPLIQRLERNRVLHLASSQVQLHLAAEAQERLNRAEQLLHRMLGSRALRAAELYLRVRQRGKPQFSRNEIRELLDHPPPRTSPP